MDDDSRLQQQPLTRLSDHVTATDKQTGIPDLLSQGQDQDDSLNWEWGADSGGIMIEVYVYIPYGSVNGDSVHATHFLHKNSKSNGILLVLWTSPPDCWDKHES